MGQYYMPTLISTDGSVRTLYSHDYENGLKLMEHSYVGNNFVNAVLTLIWENPLRLAWIGDYSNDVYGDPYEGKLTHEDFMTYYEAAWGVMREALRVNPEPHNIHDDPSSVLHCVKEKKKPTSSNEKKYSPEQIEKFMGSMAGKKRRCNDLRDTAIAALILGSGLRASEVCSLNTSHLADIKQGVVFVCRKGGDWEEVYVADFVYDHVARYLLQRGDYAPDDPLFLSTQGKGDPITVTGDLSLRTYVDRDGQNRTSVQINANHIEFPSRRNSAPQVPAGGGTLSSDDELPI